MSTLQRKLLEAATKASRKTMLFNKVDGQNLSLDFPKVKLKSPEAPEIVSKKRKQRSSFNEFDNTPKRTKRNESSLTYSQFDLIKNDNVKNSTIMQPQTPGLNIASADSSDSDDEGTIRKQMAALEQKLAIKSTKSKTNLSKTSKQKPNDETLDSETKNLLKKIITQQRKQMETKQNSAKLEEQPRYSDISKVNLTVNEDEQIHNNLNGNVSCNNISKHNSVTKLDQNTNSQESDESTSNVIKSRKRKSSNFTKTFPSSTNKDGDDSDGDTTDLLKNLVNKQKQQLNTMQLSSNKQKPKDLLNRSAPALPIELESDSDLYITNSIGAIKTSTKRKSKKKNRSNVSESDDTGMKNKTSPVKSKKMNTSNSLEIKSSIAVESSSDDAKFLTNNDRMNSPVNKMPLNKTGSRKTKNSFSSETKLCMDDTIDVSLDQEALSTDSESFVNRHKPHTNITASNSDSDKESKVGETNLIKKIMNKKYEKIKLKSKNNSKRELSDNVVSNIYKEGFKSDHTSYKTKQSTIMESKFLSNIEDGDLYEKLEMSTNYNYDSITSDYEIYTLQLPKMLDLDLLSAKSMSFSRETKLLKNRDKVFVCNPQKHSTKQLQIITEDGLKCIETVGRLVVSERLRGYHNLNSDFTQFKRSDLIVPFPSNLKTRHPLFGFDYEQNINLQADLKLKLHNAFEKSNWCKKRK